MLYKKQKKIKLPFHIILLGQITSGKETQSKLLLKKYNLKTVESGVFTRMVLKEKSKRGDDFRKTAGKGWAAPMKYMKVFFTNAINKCPSNSTLLFLGGPRLKPEAQLLSKLFKKNNQDFICFYISLPDKEIYRRSFSRSTGSMKEIYKIFDTDKKIIANRISWHKEQVSKTVEYFKKIGFFKKINGNQTVEKVAEDIEKVVQLYTKKKTLL